MNPRFNQTAIDLRSRLGVPEDILLDPMDLLRRLKFEGLVSNFLEVSDIELGSNEATWVAEDRTIKISSSLWSRLQNGTDAEARFAVLHEVAHCVLGHTTRNRRRGGKLQFGRFVDSDEQEADDFAVALGIPLSLFVNSSRHDAAGLAEVFGLPVTHTERRLVELQKMLRSPVSEDELDTYAEAMSAMFQNSKSWNL